MNASSIIARESAAARGMGSTNSVRIPKPEQKTRDALESLGVTFGDRVDHVLVNATLPAGFRIVCTGSDQRHRQLVDGEGKTVAYIFLKDSGYDYYGSTTLA